MSKGFNLSNATPDAREGFFHALRLHAAGKDERRTYKRVQLAKVGDWPTGGSAAAKPFTRETFDAILASADKAIPTVGISHKSPEKNGQNGTPSLATIRNVAVDTDPDTGEDALYGDLEQLPVWAAEEYPRRSVELMVYPDGRTVLTRLALLGDEAAAIPDLAPMPDGGELVAAAAVDGRIADTTSPTGADQPDPHGLPDQNEEGAAVDSKALNELRESLGLAEGTDEAAILAAAIERAKTPVVAEAEAVTEEAAQVTEEPKVEEQATVAAALAPETVAQIQADAAELRKYRDAERQTLLDKEIDRVVDGGGFHRDTAAVYVTAAASDFDGTIAKLKAHPLGLIAPLDGERGVAIEAAAVTDDEQAGYEYLRSLRTTTTEAK